MKKIALLITLPIVVFSFSNFTTQQKEHPIIITTSGGAMVTFAGKRSGEIKLEIAQKTTELFARYPKNGKVLTYILILNFNDKVYEYKGKGNKLTSEMLAGLKKIKAGKNIIFKDIKVEWREGKSMPAPSITLKLT